MKQVNDILNGFEAIHLDEMGEAKLMDRVDTKYVFHEEILPSLLEDLKAHYRVLDVNDHRISAYESLYFDTPEFDLFQNHQNGKLNRYKFRFRKYLESDLLFFEIKFKNNKGRTRKTRTENQDYQLHSNHLLMEFIHDHSNLEGKQLEKKIWVNYKRITLVNKLISERVTIDINLVFSDEKNEEALENIIIAEVKQNKSCVSPFIQLMRDRHIRRGSISKYCIGVSKLFLQLKTNNFKPFIKRINKLSK